MKTNKNKNSRWMVAAVVLLVVLNISALALMWLKIGQKPEPPGSEFVRNNQNKVILFFKDELGLDDEQIELFLEHRKDHQVQSRKIRDDIQILKEEMLNELFLEQPDTARVARLIVAIGVHQMELEQLTFDHFANLKELCGEPQQERLQKLLKEFFQQQHRPRPGMPQPRGDRPPPPPRN